MPSKVAPVLRAFCAAGLLALCVAAAAAERKSPLIGATKDEVLARFGEPKSHIVAGPREVLFFATERIVLRDNRVVEVEDIHTEAPAPTPKPVAKPTPAAPAPETSSAEPVPVDGTPSATTRRATPDAASEKATEPASVVVVPQPEPEVQIKSVRPPSRTVSSPAAAPASEPSVSSAASAAPSPAPTTPAVEPVAPAKTSAQPPVEVVASPQPASTQPASPQDGPAVVGTPAAAPSTVTPQPAPEPATVSNAPQEPAPSAAASAKPESQAPAAEPPGAASSPAAATAAQDHSAAPAAKPTPAAKRVRSASAHPEVVVPDAAESVFTTTNKLIAFAVILIGGGYLVWRRRQRTMLFEVTAVSRSPFVAETPVPSSTTGSKFTQELLQKLEWCRFEELVAAYYNKTGVVAVRTKSGPDSAVHIRISWKGEQRPFACVQCIANPAELVGPSQVQALCEVLAGDDIRRGYVVTSGKFSVPARDLAEEKHVTLLSGDIFLEKLNALPETVRSELIRDATSGDYTTPTCPKCEIKTVRADGSSWKCVQCGTELAH